MIIDLIDSFIQTDSWISLLLIRWRELEPAAQWAFRTLQERKIQSSYSFINESSRNNSFTNHLPRLWGIDLQSRWFRHTLIAVTNRRAAEVSVSREFILVGQIWRCAVCSLIGTVSEIVNNWNKALYSYIKHKGMDSCKPELIVLTGVWKGLTCYFTHSCLWSLDFFALAVVILHMITYTYYRTYVHPCNFYKFFFLSSGFGPFRQYLVNPSWEAVKVVYQFYVYTWGETVMIMVANY